MRGRSTAGEQGGNESEKTARTGGESHRTFLIKVKSDIYSGTQTSMLSKGIIPVIYD